MRKLNDLIKRLCPNGVIYESLNNIVAISTGKLNANEMVEDGEYAFFTCDAKPFKIDKYAFDGEAILISGNGSQVGHLNYYVGKFNAYQRTYVLMDFKSNIIPKYLYYYLNAYLKKHIDENSKKGSVPYITLPMLQMFKVPIPPLEIQKKIVNIIDKFERNINIILTEQEICTKQYKYVINKLLMNDNYKKHKIKEICKISKGKSPIQKTIPGQYPMVVTTDERKSSIDYQYDTKAVCVPLVSSRGHGIASLNHVYYQEGKFALGTILCAIESIDEKIINPKFLYYYLESTKDYLLVPLMKGGANVSLHMEDIYNVEIIVPNIEKQNIIVCNLDKIVKYQKILYEKLELVKKQYEYYRNKLLSFEELSVSE